MTEQVSMSSSLHRESTDTYVVNAERSLNCSYTVYIGDFQICSKCIATVVKIFYVHGYTYVCLQLNPTW